MDEKYLRYCGPYCENCSTKAKVEPAARVLYSEMRHAGFEEIMRYLPDGEAFWSFLKGMAEKGACVSCRNGSGDPGCEIRRCAQEKGVEICALCKSYPCKRFSKLFRSYPTLKADNALLCRQAMEQWAKLQDDRKADGYTYLQNK